MNFLVTLIEKEKEDLDKKTIEYVIKYLYKEGHMSYTVQYHYEIYQFYSKALAHYESIGLQKKCAFIDTCQHFDIGKTNLYDIIKAHSAK
jgi:hypothetical protein